MFIASSKVLDSVLPLVDISVAAFSFLFFEYFGVTFVVVEDMGVNELGFTIVIIGAVLTLLGNIIADVSYAVADPRIRIS